MQELDILFNEYKAKVDAIDADYQAKTSALISEIKEALQCGKH